PRARSAPPATSTWPACRSCINNLRSCGRRWRRSSTMSAPAASVSCRIRASSCTGRIQPVSAAIEAVEHLIAHRGGVRDAERSVREVSARGERRAVARVERVQPAPAPDAAQCAGNEDDRDAAVAPGQVLREATAHDDATVGGVERGESAATQRLPVVVVDRVRDALAAGGPYERAVPENSLRVEVHV